LDSVVAAAGVPSLPSVVSESSALLVDLSVAGADSVSFSLLVVGYFIFKDIDKLDWPLWSKYAWIYRLMRLSYHHSWE
jgi:hypothetical protein